jgi:hypothetical protein
VRRADNLTTLMCRLSRNPGALTSRIPQGHVGLFWVYLPYLYFIIIIIVIIIIIIIIILCSGHCHCDASRVYLHRLLALLIVSV